MPVRFRCIHSITFTTTIALASRWIQACFVLFPIRLAPWTFHVAYFILFLLLDTLSLAVNAICDRRYDIYKVRLLSGEVIEIVNGIADVCEQNIGVIKNNLLRMISVNGENEISACRIDDGGVTEIANDPV